MLATVPFIFLFLFLGDNYGKIEGCIVNVTLHRVIISLNNSWLYTSVYYATLVLNEVTTILKEPLVKYKKAMPKFYQKPFGKYFFLNVKVASSGISLVI